MVEELETVHPKGKTNLADLESSQLSANSGFASQKSFSMVFYTLQQYCQRFGFLRKTSLKEPWCVHC